MNRVVLLTGGSLLAIVFGIGFILFGGTFGIGAAFATRGENVGGFVMVGLGLLLILAGMAGGIWALIMGLKEGMGNDSTKPVEVAKGVSIISKLVLDKAHSPVFEPEHYDPDEIDYLVQVKFANGSKEEFKTSPECFATIGEGLNGEITYQGKWLSRFVMERKPDTSQGRDIPPDPFASGQL
jgi:hypothetical protein